MVGQHLKFSQKHDETCSDCKNTIYEFLRKIYGNVKFDYKVRLSTNIEHYKKHPYYKYINNILKKLKKSDSFVKTRYLTRCDFFVVKQKIIVELDESQHFTKARKLSLKNYPKNIKLGFDKNEWVHFCDKLNRMDRDPIYKKRDRDERRAWYDTLKDIIPLMNGFKPTIRIYMGNFKWCSLNPENENDIKIFKEKLRLKYGQK
ncbi:MAG: hypothetical protein QXZ43_01440 [Candidatus Aenigmatarchaeota archaeon]